MNNHVSVYSLRSAEIVPKGRIAFDLRVAALPNAKAWEDALDVFVTCSAEGLPDIPIMQCEAVPLDESFQN